MAGIEVAFCLAGIILMAGGTVATGGAVALEIIYKEPIWMILMKITAWVFALGGVLLGVGLGM